MFSYKHTRFQQTSIFQAKTICLKIPEGLCQGLVSFQWHGVSYCPLSVRSPPSPTAPRPIAEGVSMAVDLQQGLAGSFVGVGGVFLQSEGLKQWLWAGSIAPASQGSPSREAITSLPQRACPAPWLLQSPHPHSCYSILGLF